MTASDDAWASRITPNGGFLVGPDQECRCSHARKEHVEGDHDACLKQCGCLHFVAKSMGAITR